MEQYLTISKNCVAEYEEKRSRFIANAYPCENEETAMRIISELRSKYWDARHNVYAYILREGASRFSDDGEPHGTAGKPMLDVLQGSGLTDVLVVVTRYFGGVLLGTGGLVRAYSTATRDVLNSAEVVRMCPCTVFSVNCEYSDHQLLNRIIEDNYGSIIDTEYTADITVKFALENENADSFLTKLREVFSARLEAVEIEKKYSAFLYKK